MEMNNRQSRHERVVEQLDRIYLETKRQILENQSAITGLFPHSSAERSSACIKSSLWASSSVFALYLAYSKRVDHDQGKAHDLGQSVVKCMRGILFAWMRQSEKVELFKANQSTKHALHLRFDLHSGLANDNDYPHLQIDVVSLYLIFLSTFIASGLDIVYCMDEVTFIQNLVYYVERAYRTPDYGNWEPPRVAPPTCCAYGGPSRPPAASFTAGGGGEDARCSNVSDWHLGDQQKQQQTGRLARGESQSASNSPQRHHHHQTSHDQQHQHPGAPGENLSQQRADGRALEIHATSIGMAKSALEAINGCNLFGGRGANWSIVYSDVDAHSRNRSIFETLLPRESRSKNTDAYLLATISWPCFATHDPQLYKATKTKILRRLRGRYGFRRFPRDAYGTALDASFSALAFSNSTATATATATYNSNSNCDSPATASLPRAQPQPTSSESTHPGVDSLTCSGLSPRVSPHKPPHGCVDAGAKDANNNPRASSPAAVGAHLRVSAGNNFNMINNNQMSSSGTSSALGEPPKVKQRKSSYFQRKNIIHSQLLQHHQQHQSSLGNHLGSRSSSGDDLSLRPLSVQRTDSLSMSKKYEHIESEWPIYVCFLIIDGIFKQDAEQVSENEKILYERLLKLDETHGDYLMPKFYYVPGELISSEKCNPESVERLASAEGSSSDMIFLTGQSVLLTTRLLLAGLVHPNELDPLRRHMPTHDRPKRIIGRYSSFQATSSDLVVQTVLIAESIRLQAMMANYGIQTQTPLEVEPVQIWSSSQLVKVYEYLGVNDKLGLKGRPARPIGALGTSKIYRICGQTILCYPLIFEVSDFYLAQDMMLLIDDIQNELDFIGRYWRMSGRPTVCILIREDNLKDVHFRDLLDLLVQFKNGKLDKSGLRIKTGRLQNLISSSCIEHLDFLHLLPHEHLPQFQSFRQLVESPNKSSLLHTRSRTVSISAATRSRGSGRRSQQQLKSEGSGSNLQSIEERANASSSCSSLSSESMSTLTDACRQRDSSFEQLNFHHTHQPLAAAAATRGDSTLGKRAATDKFQYCVVASNCVDYRESYKEAPTWPTLAELLRVNTGDLHAQSQLLAILWEREGPKYQMDARSIEERMEQVAHLAGQQRNWSVVRFCSAVLGRSVESLAPWLTNILVNGKQISLGAGEAERVVSNPLTPIEIHQLVYSTLSLRRPSDAVLQQEIALYIGRLISTRPDYFEGILTIRVTNFMSAMRSYLAIKTAARRRSLQDGRRVLTGSLGASGGSSGHLSAGNNSSAQQEQPEETDDQQQQQQQLLDLRVKPQISVELSPPQPPANLSAANGPPPSAGRLSAPPVGLGGSRPRRTLQQNLVAKPLESLSPSDVRRLLVKVLTDVDSLPISDRRRLMGELCRVPKNFYDKVWALLGCTGVGIVIGGQLIRSLPTLTTMTPDNLNFALKVESMLSAIECPKLRQVNVELLVSLHKILERNPEIRFESEPLDLDKVINLSLAKFRFDLGRADCGLDEYYAQSPESAMLYTLRTVFDCLLPTRREGTTECRLS